MAWYSVAYACGHTAEKQLYGKTVERERFIDWAAKFGICDNCREGNAQAACESIESEYDLPPLTGSEKQIAWARKIRSEKINEIVEFIAAKLPEVPAEMMDEFEIHRAAVMQGLYSKTMARYWIDNQDKSGRTLAQDAYTEGRK